MVKELKSKKIEEIGDYIKLFDDIERLQMLIEDSKKGNYNFPARKFNFFERFFTKRKEYKQEQVLIKQNIEAHNSLRNQWKEKIAQIDGILNQESYKRFGHYRPDIDDFIKEIERIKNASTIQELGFRTEDEAVAYLETNGIVKKVQSEEDAKMFPDTAYRSFEYMEKMVKTDPNNIKYDRTNSPELYKIYLQTKLTQQNSNLDEISRQTLQDYLAELNNPKVVEEGMYKVPHEFMFDELRKMERHNFACTTAVGRYNYLNVDGKFSKAYGKQIENLYTRDDIILGMHGTSSVQMDKYMQKGLRESSQNESYRTLSNTVLYGDSLTFTTALNYASICNGGVAILGLPKDTFDEKNPAHIWGSKEAKGSNHILPKFMLGYYIKKDNDGSTRTIIMNDGRDSENYRYLHVDAAMDRDDSRIIDAESPDITKD